MVIMVMNDPRTAEGKHAERMKRLFFFLLPLYVTKTALRKMDF